MKKVIYIIVALLAFILGASVYYVQPLFVPISLSELNKNESHYKFLKIKIVAKLEVTEENSHYFVNLKDWEADCSGDNLVCFRGLELSEELMKENMSLIKEIVEKNKTVKRSTLINDNYWAADGEYYVDVEVTGRLDEKEDKNFGGTYFGGIYYDIKVEKIKQNSPIKFVPIKELLRE